MNRFTGVALILMSALAVAAAAQEAKPQHGATLPSEIQWLPGPPSLPAGAKVAVLEGDPTQEGIFTMRLSMPDGYKISPHWHPAFEHITVMSGTFQMGMGDTFDKAKGHPLSAGAFGWMAPGVRHFAWAQGDTVVQLHGMGPWQIYYVNAADDPRKAAK